MHLPRWMLPLALVSMAAMAGTLPATPAAAPWSRAQVHEFLQSAAAAERMPDRLQACLAYPDPPGSHWSRATVQAACRYYVGPSPIAQEEILDLIHHGRFAELDRRFAHVLQQQREGKAPQESLDVLYLRSFLDTKTMRPAVDRWKHGDPRSAFALAASGQVAVTEAEAARGDKPMDDTPGSSVGAMGQLIERAKADLEQAVRIEPHLTPAWVAMIDAGLGDAAYAHDAAQRTSAAEPLDFGIYEARSWLAQPKWGGSDEELLAVAREAAAHADRNPLLALYQTEPAAIALDIDDCGCHTEADPAVFRQVFDHAARPRLYAGAGFHAAGRRRPDLAAVYVSEALRFGYGEAYTTLQRSQALLQLGELDFVFEASNRRLAKHPDEEEALSMRATVYSYRRDQANAEKDLLHVLAVTKNDRWALTQLGYGYVFNTREVAKAAAIADRLVREYPDNPDGLFLRAHVQAGTHDPRLKETVAAFETKFGADPAQRDKLMQMKGFLQMVPTVPKR